ncbi:MAG: response regulator [Saprospiraceae bacterium]
MIKVGIIEDDSFVRNELVKIIKMSSKLEYILSSESAENFLKYFPDELDIVLLDIELPGMTGIEALPKIRTKNGAVEVVMLTAFRDSDRIFKALRAGASGYMLKDNSLDKIEQTLIDLKEGVPALSPDIARRMITFFNQKRTTVKDIQLTEKEGEVLKYLIDGLSYKMIANEMDNSINSVRYHVKNIYKKLHINSRPELVKLYLDGKIKLD